MIQLSRDAFNNARRFLKDHARPLDRALFEYRFEKASLESVLMALASYQNDDGGFGHGLEPDSQTPTSSSLATGIGLSLLAELGLSSQHPMVRNAVAFLLETFDQDSNGWLALPPDANDYPHAPWWHDHDGSLALTFDHFIIIPRAQIVGLLLDYSELVPGAWLADLARATVDDILKIEQLGTGGGDDLRYAMDLALTAGLPQDLKEPLIQRIRSVVPLVISTDPQEWLSYSLTPLKASPAPNYPAADLIGDQVGRYLDYLIREQTPLGYWQPTWSWGDSYPQVWKQVEIQWRGHLTLETLTSLRAYARLE